MPEDNDNKFMRRGLELAARAEGMTYPNPMVGAVIVNDSVIIAEGYHLKAGTAHAEVLAINSVSDKSLLSKSTLYVTLEPCSHFGETPPCTDLIISHKIPEIVVGTTDTSEKVSGNGLKQLKEAGCEVKNGILEEECRMLNKRFFTFHEKKRPYIILKWAQSADGYIDIIRNGKSGTEPYRITGKPERVLVHKWRAAEQAILVGAGTIRADNPKLNVRDWKGNDPVKIILSGSGNLNKDLAVNETNGTVIVFTYNTEADFGKAEKIILIERTNPAVQIIEYLYKSGIQSMLIEGGSEVLNFFIAQGLWDEAKIFCGNTYFNGGIKAPGIKGKHFSSFDFESSKLEVLINDGNNTKL